MTASPKSIYLRTRCCIVRCSCGFWYILFNYEIGKQVLRINQSKLKDRQNFLGPYKIVEISKNKNRICIEDESKKEWISIRNVKPFFGEGGRCRGSEIRHDEF